MTKHDAHPDSQRLALYVMDALSAEESTAIEAHVASCDGCAHALEREARLELTLSELYRRSSRATPVLRPLDSPPLLRHRRAIRVLAVAAGFVLVIVGGGSMLKQVEVKVERTTPIIDPWAPPSETLEIAGPPPLSDPIGVVEPDREYILGGSE
jgi:anti-sigma factor RsiW